MTKTKKILCCLMILVIFSTLGFNIYASSATVPPNDDPIYRRWYGMGLKDVSVEFSNGTVGTPENQNPASYYDSRDAYMAYSLSFSGGVYDNNAYGVDLDRTQSKVTLVPIETSGSGYYGFTDITTEYFFNREFVESHGRNIFGYMVSDIATRSNNSSYTVAKFEFDPFYVNQKTMDPRTFLWITPYSPIQGTLGSNPVDYNKLNMYVTFEYDIVVRNYDADMDSYSYYKGHRTESDWWKWEDIMNRGNDTITNGYSTQGCFMPPSIVQPMMANIETHYGVFDPDNVYNYDTAVVSNLQVTVHNFVGNYVSTFGSNYNYSLTKYAFTGFGTDVQRQTHFDANIINADEGGVNILQDLDDLGVLNAPDGFVGGNDIEMNWLARSLGAIIDFEIFPDFSIGGLLGIILGLCFLIAFLKIFAGG